VRQKPYCRKSLEIQLKTQRKVEGNAVFVLTLVYYRFKYKITLVYFLLGGFLM
jgi:hypothetical protein